MRLRASRSTTVRAGAVLAVLSVILLVAWRSGLFAMHDRARLAAFIAELRGWPLLIPGFIATYAITAAAGVPVTPLTLAGGVLFGATRGVLLNWIAEVLAASLAFSVTRFTIRTRRPAPMTAENLFRLRLIPVVPFALLNAGAALSEMSWSRYLLATAAGIVPVTVIYTISAAELVAGVAGSGARALLAALSSAAVLIGLSFLLPRLSKIGGAP